MGRNAFLTRAWWLRWDGKAYVGLPLNMKTCAPHKELKYVLLWQRAHQMGKWDEHANMGSCHRHLYCLCTFGGNFTLPLIPGLCGQGSGYTFGSVLWWIPLCLGRTWPRCQAEGQGQGHWGCVDYWLVLSHHCCSGTVLLLYVTFPGNSKSQEARPDREERRERARGETTRRWV